VVLVRMRTATEAKGLFAPLSAACAWWMGWINYIAGERPEGARWAWARAVLIIDVGPGWQTLGAAEQ
jgi:hypothetical protein